MFVCRTFSLKFSVVLECEQYIKPPKANERKPCVADHIVCLGQTKGETVLGVFDANAEQAGGEGCQEYADAVMPFARQGIGEG